MKSKLIQIQNLLFSYLCLSEDQELVGYIFSDSGPHDSWTLYWKHVNIEGSEDEILHSFVISEKLNPKQFYEVTKLIEGVE